MCAFIIIRYKLNSSLSHKRFLIVGAMFWRSLNEVDV